MVEMIGNRRKERRQEAWGGREREDKKHGGGRERKGQ